MREHNELTKKLLAEGYTAENYPDYVILPGSCWGNDKLQNLSGGFEYKREVSNKFVYKTGCGMYLLGKNAITHMSFMGYSWMHENYIVVTNCPYRKTDCELNNPVLNYHKFKHCECRRVNEEYNYDNSVESMWKKRTRKRQAVQGVEEREMAGVHKSRVYNWDEGGRNYSPHAWRCTIVSVIYGSRLIRKRNVYYDEADMDNKRRHTLDGTEQVRIVKGKSFPKIVSATYARIS